MPESPFHRALLEAGPLIGLPRLADLNDLDASVGIASAPVNALGAVRWNAAFAYLDEARSRPNLTIAAETLVDRVEIATGSGRVRSVGVVSDSGRLSADIVIVAAGAYGSPAVLLRSGIGPQGQVRPLGVGVAAAHVPDQGPVFATSLLVRARSESCPKGTCDLHFLPWFEEADEGWRTSAVVYLLKPDSRGSITLRSPDPRVPPSSTTASSPNRTTSTASRAASPSSAPDRHLCDRDGRRYTRRGTRRRGAARRGRLDHAHDPSREHEPEHHRRRRTDRRLASRLSQSRRGNE